MFGKLLSGAIKIITLPIDITESGMDVLCGDSKVKLEIIATCKNCHEEIDVTHEYTISNKALE